MLKGLTYNLKSLLKKPFKVGIIVWGIYEEKKGGGGVAIHAYHLATELAKLGCEVHVFTKGEKNSQKTKYMGEGKFILHKINIKTSTPLEDLTSEIRMNQIIFENLAMQEISKENFKEKFDVIHTHNIGTGGALVSKYTHNVPWVNTFHSLERTRIVMHGGKESKFLDVTKWSEGATKYADALITVSDKLKLELLQNYPVKAEKVFSIPNGVDLELFTPDNIPQDNKKLLYIGRFGLEKGIDIVYRISKKILELDPKIKIELVAPGIANSPKLERVEKSFNELLEKYPDRIVLHREKIDRQELKKMYDECLVYIQPSRYESFGMTVLEAMACGKAVIVSNKGGLPEVVGNAGKIIPFNTNLFVREILKLLKDFKLRERYGRRGIERAKDFTWEKISKQTLDLYKKISKPEEKKIEETQNPKT